MPSNFWILRGSEHVIDDEYVWVPGLVLEQATLIFEMELFLIW